MISIIIPTLNEEKSIGKILSNLKSKITIPHEVIISDGKSTDKTVEIARLHADKVVEYKGEKRQTIAQGRNDGASAAQGEFLVFMDADCFVLNPDDFFTRAIKDFEDQKLMALSAWLSVEPSQATLMDKIVFNIQNVFNILLNNYLNVGMSPGGEFQMIRATAFRSIGGYNESLVTAEDIDLFKRLAKIGKTRIDRHLRVFHSGRRAHKIGWPKLLWSWFMSTVSTTFFKKSYFKEWTPIR